MQGGRKAKPTAFKVLEGNPGQRKLNTNELRPAGEVDRPDFLEGQAIKEWDRITGCMPPGFFTAADVPVLTTYCTAWANHRNAQITLQREGLETVGSQGQTVAHPAIAIAAKQAEIMLKAADRLGLHPVARTKLQMPDEKRQSKFSGLIGGRTA